MKALALLILFAVVANAASPRNPKLSETFQSKVDLWIQSRTRGEDYGQGMWAQDASTKSAIEDFAFNKGEFDSWSLDRYDLDMLYRIMSPNKSRCDQFKLENETMPLTWGWLDSAKFIGQWSYERGDVDVWELAQGYATRRLAVFSNSTSTPAWQENRGNERTVFIRFDTYSTVAPASSVFAVPSVCKTPSGRRPMNDPLKCRSAADIMKIAEDWVAHHVGYNQEGRYMDYRTDCSGYVSCCWQSGAPGKDTMEFHEMSHPIKKSELKAGDCMLYAADHVVLFGGWTSDAKTHYWGYEETQPCSTNPNWCGTRKDDIVYPYYYDPSKFLPYRYNDFCG